MEYVRHRVFSFAQESTRYCNYSKDKFGNELTFIIPCWMNLIEGSYKYVGYAPVFELNNEEKTFICSQKTYQNTIDYQSPPNEEDLEKIKQENKLFNWLYSIWNSEKSYLEDIKFGATPQQARSVLPNSLKTELIMTGFISDWEHFFSLRYPSSAHPQARELAAPLHEEFKKLQLI